MKTEHIVLFDGVCNLCNKSVQTLIRWDRNDLLKFASLQSDFGQNVLAENGIDKTDFDSFLYLKGEQIYTKSDAALKICYDLKNMYQLLYTFILIPKPIRDFVYSFIAKNRYKYFGKRESCMIPDKSIQNKFLK